MSKTRPLPSFEDALSRLNEIVIALDDEETTLAATITLYEEGIGLLERCAAELRTAEQKLVELRRRADGVFELIDIQE